MKPFKVTMVRAWRFYTVVSIILVFSLLLISCKAEDPKYSSTEELIPKQKMGIVSFDLSITPEAGEDINLWLPYPTSNEYQLITDVNINGNYDSVGVYKEPQSDSIVLYAEWLKPNEQATISYSFKVAREEIMKKDFQEYGDGIPVELEQYLLATNLGPITGDVQETALEITKGRNTILVKATAIYDWIVENFRRDPNITGCGVGDVESLLNIQAGKCTDISSVFVALARSVGVPAREIFGIRMAKDGDITSAYHCRAEFYLPGYGWVPVDPSDVRKFMLKNERDLNDPDVVNIRDYYFGMQTETYIDFYSGRDLVLVPRQTNGPLNYLMYPYVEVGDKILDWFAQEDLKYTVTFEEL